MSGVEQFPKTPNFSSWPSVEENSFPLNPRTRATEDRGCNIPEKEREVQRICDCEGRGKELRQNNNTTTKSGGEEEFEHWSNKTTAKPRGRKEFKHWSNTNQRNSEPKIPQGEKKRRGIGGTAGDLNDEPQHQRLQWRREATSDR